MAFFSPPSLPPSQYFNIRETTKLKTLTSSYGKCSFALFVCLFVCCNNLQHITASIFLAPRQILSSGAEVCVCILSKNLQHLPHTEKFCNFSLKFLLGIVIRSAHVGWEVPAMSTMSSGVSLNFKAFYYFPWEAFLHHFFFFCKLPNGCSLQASSWTENADEAG